MSDLHQVVTPENIEIDYEIAGIGSRFFAIAIDMLIQTFFTIGIVYGLSLVGLKQLNLEEKIESLPQSLIGVIFIILLAVVWLGYYIILETAWNGQTIGKRLVNIRVRKELGYAPNLWDITLRNIIRLVDFLPFGYSVGFIAMFCNKNAKRLGDFAAGTIVVKELPRKNLQRYLHTQSVDSQYSFEPDKTDGNETYAWLEPLLPKLTQPDYLLLHNLYSRRAQLSNYSQLALDLITKLLTKAPEINVPVLDPYEATLILPELVRRYEKAHFAE